MSKILCIGDIHGDFKPIRDLANHYNQKEVHNRDDVVISLGDFGANFFMGRRDDEFKGKLSVYNFTYFVIRGNHEQRPSICMEQNPDKWHFETFWDNSVYVENAYPYIKYALDIPACYNIPTAFGEPIKTLVLPGAYSVDKDFRIKNGWSWFEQEQLNKNERSLGSELAEFGQPWDLILSHTCPVIYEPTDLFLSCVDQSTVDKTMERWLGEIEYNTIYRLWIWGHYHSNRIYPTYNHSDRLMLFNDCAFDVYKFFCGNYKLENCLEKIKNDTRITNLNIDFS